MHTWQPRNMAHRRVRVEEKEGKFQSTAVICSIMLEASGLGQGPALGCGTNHGPITVHGIAHAASLLRAFPGRWFVA